MLLFWVVITPMELCTAFSSGSCGKNHACSVSCFSVNSIQFYMADIGTQRCAACPMCSSWGTRWWAGRDNATLTETALSHANRLKTRRLPPVGCIIPVHFRDAVLGRFCH